MLYIIQYYHVQWYSYPVAVNHFKPYADIKAELQAQLKKMEGALAAGNQDEIISFYTNDCRLLPPGAPMKVGEHGILFICLVGTPSC